MASPTLAPVSPEHPLANLGLDIHSTEGPSLLESLAHLPGAPQAEQAREAAGTEALVREQVNPGATPWQRPELRPQQQLAQSPTPQQPQPEQVKQFNQELQQAQAGPVEQYQEPEGVVVAEEEWEYVTGLLQAQGEAIAAMQAGQPPQPTGPAGVPVASFAAPAAAPGQPLPQAAPQVAPIAVPKITAAEISESEFESLTTDRTAFAAYLTKHDQATAASVTEQLSQTILPHVYGMMKEETEKQSAIAEFVRANPDFAEDQGAVTAAINEAKRLLPYAKSKQIMYHAGQQLRKAMATNEQIQSSVHDFRGKPPRRAAVINNPQLRRGPGNEAPTNPYTDLMQNMIQRRQNREGILDQMGLRK